VPKIVSAKYEEPKMVTPPKYAVPKTE